MSPRTTTNASSPSCLPGTRCPLANPAMVNHARPERSAAAICYGLRSRPTSRLACWGGRRDATSQPVRLPHENTPQGSTTQDATELLQRGTAAAGEAHVAARTRAGKFLSRRCLVIALARELSRRIRVASPGGTSAPAVSLLAAVASALLAATVALISPPQRPSAGRVPTGGATISCERMPWLEQPLATFQQTEPLSATSWGLPGR